MADTNKNPKVLEAAHAPNRLETLQSLSSGLEKCQKSLNDYLDSKRNAFPRFFFISDDELLSILGSHEATCVQEHMIKVTLYVDFFICFSPLFFKLKGYIIVFHVEFYLTKILKYQPLLWSDFVSKTYMIMVGCVYICS